MILIANLQINMYQLYIVNEIDAVFLRSSVMRHSEADITSYNYMYKTSDN